MLFENNKMASNKTMILKCHIKIVWQFSVVQLLVRTTYFFAQEPEMHAHKNGELDYFIFRFQGYWTINKEMRALFWVFRVRWGFTKMKYFK